MTDAPADKGTAFEELKRMLRPGMHEYQNGVMAVDEKKCLRCGLCILNCPFKCWETGTDRIPRMKADHVCFSCCNCMVACRAGAISVVQVFKIRSGFFDTRIPDATMPAKPKDAEGKPARWTNVERLIMNRRSVRHFKKNPVPESLIRRVLEAGRFAPSAGNLQPWKFTVVTDPEFISQLEEACHGAWAKLQRMMTDEEQIAKLIGKLPISVFDPRVQQGLSCVVRRELPIFFKAPVVIFLGSSDRFGKPEMHIGICGQNMNLTAISLGLGFVWDNFGTIVNNIPELKTKLGFDDMWSIHASACLGYPKFKQEGLVPRQYRPVTWFRPESATAELD